ncbi:hypothetical protein FLM9_217 [Candidatus Synechococcus spongiarum]|uniref:Uncharacterized protein n=1 Tax=Candidatus Synechococcus spongiarum TaxID=431041 RepID=A0A164ZPX5_9SYNE|nr:hypothetical protein FLM9_217 [Candidatus Synechococcus spongiarum]
MNAGTWTAVALGTAFACGLFSQGRIVSAFTLVAILGSVVYYIWFRSR